MAKNQNLNQIEQILNSKKRKFPVFPVAFLIFFIAIISAIYFDLFNLFGNEVKEVEYKNEYVVVEKANMATTLTSSALQSRIFVNLYADSSAEVTDVYFEVGDDVVKDDLIFLSMMKPRLNLEIAKSNLSQVSLTLEELENSPTESEKLSASQTVKNAEQQLEISKQQLQNAKISLEDLLNPAESTLNSASANVVTAQSSIVSAKNTIDNTYVELLNSQKTYCDTRLTESQFEDQKAPVCSSAALPINQDNITRLLDDMKSENEPILTELQQLKHCC